MLCRMRRGLLLVVVAVLACGAAPARALTDDTALPPGEALKALTEGNARFEADRPTHRGELSVKRERLAGGQKPDAVILACSDSRVPPEVVFDQTLGDLFVVRVAGEVPGPEAVASIEYAVDHLGTNLVVVLGHTSCGAVKAGLTTPPGTSAGSPDLDRLVGAIRGNLGADLAALTADPTARVAAERNARAIADQLYERSKIVRDAAVNLQRRLRVLPALYELDTGRVVFLDTGGRH
jgi:carbonic anhydrase